MVVSLQRAFAACLSLLIGLGVAAQPPLAQRPPTTETAPLTLADAVALALARNPDLAASRYELTAVQGRITQAGLRPNPQLDVELENFAGTGAVKGFDALETTLSLSQVLELGDKRKLRVGVAEGDRDVVVAE